MEFDTVWFDLQYETEMCLISHPICYMKGKIDDKNVKNMHLKVIRCISRTNTEPKLYWIDVLLDEAKKYLEAHIGLLNVIQSIKKKPIKSIQWTRCNGDNIVLREVKMRKGDEFFA